MQKPQGNGREKMLFESWRLGCDENFPDFFVTPGMTIFFKERKCIFDEWYTTDIHVTWPKCTFKCDVTKSFDEFKKVKFRETFGRDLLTSNDLTTESSLLVSRKIKRPNLSQKTPISSCNYGKNNTFNLKRRHKLINTYQIN